MHPEELFNMNARREAVEPREQQIKICMYIYPNQADLNKKLSFNFAVT